MYNIKALVCKPLRITKETVYQTPRANVKSPPLMYNESIQKIVKNILTQPQKLRDMNPAPSDY